jgi:hypothetical protein
MGMQFIFLDSLGDGDWLVRVGGEFRHPYHSDINARCLGLGPLLLGVRLATRLPWKVG